MFRTAAKLCIKCIFLLTRNQWTGNKTLNLHLAFLSQGTCAVGVTHSRKGEVKQYEDGSRIEHHHCIFSYNKQIISWPLDDWLAGVQQNCIAGHVKGTL